MKNWLLLVLFHFSLAFVSQTRKIDSLQIQLSKTAKDSSRVNALNLLAWELKGFNPDTSIQLSSQALELAEEINFKFGAAKAQHQLGWLKILKGELDQSLTHFFKATALWDELLRNSPESQKKSILIRKAATLGNTGLAFYQKGEFNKALDCHFKSLKIFENANDTSRMASCYGNIANVYVSFANYPRAIEYLTKAKEIFQKQGNKDGVGVQLVNLGIIYLNQSDFPRALDVFQEALKIFEDLGNKNSIAAVTGNIANVYLKQTNYPKALDFYFRTLKIAEEMGNKNAQALNLGNIGNLYEEQANFQKALHYHERALKISEETGNKDKISGSLNDIGMICMDQALQTPSDSLAEALYGKASDCFFKALKMSEELGDKVGSARYLGNLGLFYMNYGGFMKEKQKKDQMYEKALTFSFKALRAAEEIGDKHGIAADLGNIGGIYARTGKFKNAEEYLNKSLAVSNEIGALKFTKIQEKSFFELDSLTGNFKGAFEHYKKYIAARDSISNMDNIRKQTQKEMQYDFDKKESIARTEQERKDIFAREEKEKQAIVRNIAIGGFIFSIVIALLIFRGYRNKKRANTIITRQKEEVEQAKIIISHQKHLVEEKHKEITDSINYAERIQRSFLATKELLNQNLPDYFVFFQPKDVVSGDFYWASTLNNSQFALVTADSTGHGVPGAIMSLLNITSLEKAIENLTAPSDILNHTRKTIIERLKKDGSAEGGKDGMDCSFISFDFKNSKLTYSAANNPVWIIRENNIIELSSDKMPVGKHDRENVPFNQHEVELMKGDVIYAITDGMPDQFGGPKGKKFMYKRLKEFLVLISKENMEIQKQKIIEEFNNWKGASEQVDDVTVVGIRI